MDSPARSEVWIVSLDPTVGSEQRKTRPCVVVQRDAANRASPTTIIVPLTDARGRTGDLLRPFVPGGEGGLSKDSLALCNQVRTVDRARLRARLGVLAQRHMSEIDRGLRAIMDL
ncbi:MAG TPA: type II toxin-antitoxin system PemK/MazF family toxin [Candidatus Binatia bacterium]|nr:type II toxin-antitoxin system PemK/MazF family toxin [Candidatus Binatia bacterium]